MSNEEAKKIRRIQVPNHLIVNRDFPHDAFALYVELKRSSFNNKANVYPIQLKNKIGWTDNRKLKRYLKILYDYSLIDQEIDRISNHKPITLLIKDIACGEEFTQVDVLTLDRIKECANTVKITGKSELQNVYEIALRLFYYYEKNYNEDYGRAFPTYEQINKDTKIHHTYIKAINTIFDENDIVRVRLGEYYTKEIDHETVIQRAGNQYIPMCIRY